MAGTLLGSEFVDATIAGAGTQNAGMWTAEFGPAQLGVGIAEFEIYHIALKNGPPGSKFDIYIGTSFWDSVTPGDVNSWDPNQPMRLIQGQHVYFYWNSGAGMSGPTVTVWLREVS